MSLPSAGPTHQNHLSRDLHALGGVLLRGWRYVAVSIALCLTLGAIYLAKTRREYQSTTRILVSQQGGRPLNVGNSDPTRALEGDDDFVPTHMAILSSPVVVGRAVEVAGLAKLPSLSGAEDPVKEAFRNLKVTRPDRGARVLRLDYRAWSPEEANLMAAAIADSYKEFLDKTFQKNNGEVVALITKARDELSQELSSLEQQFVEFQETHPVLATDASGRPLATRRLDEWDRASQDALMRIVQVRGQLELGRKLSQEGVDPGAILQALNQLGDKPGELHDPAADGALNLNSGYLGRLVQEQQELVEKYGPSYARVKAVQEQIARATERASEARAAYQGSAVQDLLTALDRTAQALEARRAEYDDRLATDREESKKAEVEKLYRQSLASNLERNRTLFNTVVDQLRQAQFIHDFASVSSHMIEPPAASDKPVTPLTTLTLALSLVAGCVLGAAAAFAADVLDPRIRSLESMRRTIDLPVLGHVPLVPANHALALGELGLIGMTKPRSVWSESYRVVRTNLDFLRRNRRIQVLLVASPASGDGKSTTASNLAIVQAQAGRRVLLVDADLRKPSQQRVHGAPNDLGLSSILGDGIPFSQVFQRTSVENLDLLTAGPDVPNPAELLSSPAMAEFVAEVRESYDLIVIDSSPLLAVTDAGIIAALADGMVLVVRLGKLRQFDAEAVREMLRTQGAPVLGILANGVSRDHAEHGYGYGYGQGTEPMTRGDARRVSTRAAAESNGDRNGVYS